MEQQSIIIGSLVVAVVLGGSLFYWFAVRSVEESAPDLAQANVSEGVPEEEAALAAQNSELPRSQDADLILTGGEAEVAGASDELVEEPDNKIEDVAPTAETGTRQYVILAAMLAIGLGLWGMGRAVLARRVPD